MSLIWSLWISAVSVIFTIYALMQYSLRTGLALFGSMFKQYSCGNTYIERVICCNHSSFSWWPRNDCTRILHGPKTEVRNWPIPESFLPDLIGPVEFENSYNPEQNFVRAIAMIFKSWSLEVFISCHNKVIMSPQCNSFPRIIGDFTKLPFCFISSITDLQLTRLMLMLWWHSVYLSTSQRALRICL